MIALVNKLRAYHKALPRELLLLLFVLSSFFFIFTYLLWYKNLVVILTGDGTNGVCLLLLFLKTLGLI